MKRREVIKVLGGAAAASVSWPMAAHPQSAQPVIGLLSSLSAKPLAPFVASFHRGLKVAGHVAGQNLKVEERWADAQFDRLPAMAKELVDLKARVIATIGGNVSAIAAQAATSSIPIVFATADDPVATGLVTSFSRPPGNMTGITWMGASLQAKYLELLHELLPDVSAVGVLLNPARSSAAIQLRSLQAAAASIGIKIVALNATTAPEIDAAFGTIAQERIGALIVGTDPLFNNRREQIVTLAARDAVPAVYFLREFVAIGGLMSYGASLHDAFYQLGGYVGRILNGAKPADLPILQSTKVELIINLKTAKALGLTIPIMLLGRADEVIE